MVAEFSAGDTDKAWSAWQKHLMQRKRPAKLNFLKGKRPPLLWAWPAVWERDGILLEGRPLAQLAKELSGDVVGGKELPQAIQSLAIAYALPKLASKLSADVWWRLAESLCKLVRDAQQLRTDPQGDVLEVLRQQLLAGELPLALAYLFPELQPDARFAALGEGNLSRRRSSRSPTARVDRTVGCCRSSRRSLPVGLALARWESTSKAAAGPRRPKHNTTCSSDMRCGLPRRMDDS